MMSAQSKVAPEQAHHFFASTVAGWGVGPTRAAAIRKALRMSDALPTKTPVYVWSCRVELPQETKYEINNYAPQGVPKSETNAGSYRVIGKDVYRVEAVTD